MMIRTRQKLTMAGVFVAGAMFTWALGGLGPKQAQATPPSNPGFTATPLAAAVLTQDINTGAETDDWELELKTWGESEIVFAHVKLAPGKHSGWHSHPGPTFIAVKAGTATFYDDCDGAETPHRYPAGSGLVEEAGCVHILVNEGDVDLEVVFMQVIPKGAPRRIDEADPRD